MLLRSYLIFSAMLFNLALLPACSKYDRDPVEADRDIELHTAYAGNATNISFYDEFYVYSNVDIDIGDIYVVQSQSDLDTLNELISDEKKLEFEDLDQYDYFVIEDSRCPAFLELQRTVNTEGTLTFYMKELTAKEELCLGVLVLPLAIYRGSITL